MRKRPPGICSLPQYQDQDVKSFFKELDTAVLAELGMAVVLLPTHRAYDPAGTQQCPSFPFLQPDTPAFFQHGPGNFLAAFEGIPVELLDLRPGDMPTRPVPLQDHLPDRIRTAVSNAYFRYDPPNGDQPDQRTCHLPPQETAPQDTAKLRHVIPPLS